MLSHALGTIEVLGLPAAVEAADVACKSADVHLIGYETTDGMGMVTVKVEGQVSAVTSAVAAARAAASRVTRVFATSVIPRPSGQLGSVVLTSVTVGLESEVTERVDKDAPEDRRGDGGPAEHAPGADSPAAGKELEVAPTTGPAGRKGDTPSSVDVNPPPPGVPGAKGTATTRATRTGRNRRGTARSVQTAATGMNHKRGKNDE